jgi:hypothetical protein
MDLPRVVVEHLLPAPRDKTDGGAQGQGFNLASIVSSGNFNSADEIVGALNGVKVEVQEQREIELEVGVFADTLILSILAL